MAIKHIIATILAVKHIILNREFNCYHKHEQLQGRNLLFDKRSD